MKKMRNLILILSVLFLLSGCFQVEKVITVKKDGSGTIEETTLMSKQMMQQMGQSFGSKSGGEIDEASFHDVEKLKAEATKMGANVRYVSSKALDKDGKVGYKAIYAFDNINDLIIESNPAGSMMSTPGSGSGSTDNIQFNLKKGKTSELIIKFPEEKAAQGEAMEIEEAEVDPQTMQMMKAMYTGMKISMKIKFDGKIEKTNATYRKGSVITIMEMDFDKMMNNEKFMKALASGQGKSDKSMKKTFEKISKEAPGFKAEFLEEVFVKFK
ncbi:MAG: hypothetical protein KAU01_12370 [Candidatus Cloacimonetes bacterium]|nr:hypothetical protein [Candidatus Cloacimonadota bacterium]